MAEPYRNTPSWAARHMLLGSDVTSLVLSFVLAWRLMPAMRLLFGEPAHSREPLSAHVWLLGWILPLWLLLGYRYGLYARTPRGWGASLVRVLKVQALGLGAIGVLVIAFKLQSVSRLILFGFAALYVPISQIVRAAAAAAFEAHRSHIYNIPRILVVGAEAAVCEFARRSRRHGSDYFEIVGYVSPSPVPAARDGVEGVPLVGSTDHFEKFIFSNAVDVVLFAEPVEQIPHAAEMAAAAMSLGLRVAVIPRYGLETLGYDLEHPEVSLEPFLGHPVAVLSNVRPSLDYRAAKRVLDIVISATALLLLSPLFLLIAALIKLTSPGGPVFYPWNVLGTNLKPFRGYKFRTMVPNADALKRELEAQNEMTGPVFKMRNDPRVTPIGRVLRKFSLDELPQLWSVLRGDMSLVGPRPAGPDEARRYEFWQRRKLSVKPGITCLWQVNGRNHIERFDDWARMDLEYVQHASLWLDCKILLKTIPAVLSGRGAY